eukprot:GHVS01104869.1.p1 GENE.GHVS01104869.1~~GHVS01104869.1.p1  ORF type:complete len:236 (+),score=57.14 GHVS01104869.1:136-843(+)
MCDSRVVVEWRRLLSLTDVAEVAAVIKQQLKQLEHTAAAAIPKVATAAPTLISNKSPSPSAAPDFITITDFAWDQTDKHVKVYVKVPRAHEVAKENVKVFFAAQEVELKVMSPTKNYRLIVKKLGHPIKPAECSYRIKTDCVSLTLIKQSPAHWADLAFKETKIGKKPTAPADPSPASGDPGASIMNLFKDIYDQGDDDMKRTIAKAWTEANDKKKTGGGGGDLYNKDMDFMNDT